MKKLLLSLFLLTTSILNSQTLIRYDYMETWNWAGLWFTGANTGWFIDASVSSNQSAVLYGGGNGASAIEDNWYRLPNVTGLDATKLYQLKFRLASYTFSNSTAATRGVDIPDYVSVQISTNGGPYINELRITGNSNATWPYTSTGTITHTANGTFTNSAAPTGDVYQSPVGSTTTGPTFITLNLQSNITQVAVDIYCRVNSAGEEWWIDNIELFEINPLPVELISFEGISTDHGNLLTWKTASEQNSDYYLIERSTTGEFNENSVIGQKLGAGNSNQVISYNFLDNNFKREINYYRITQVDTDGNFKIYGPIAIDNRYNGKKIVKIVNLLGQEIDQNYSGIYFEIYDDGSTIKKMR